MQIVKFSQASSAEGEAGDQSRPGSLLELCYYVYVKIKHN